MDVNILKKKGGKKKEYNILFIECGTLYLSEEYGPKNTDPAFVTNFRYSSASAVPIIKCSGA